jgi:hypothetical protein
MNANIRTIGGSIGAALITSIVTATAESGHLPTSAGYTRGFIVLALKALGAGLTACLVPSNRVTAPVTLTR